MSRTARLDGTFDPRYSPVQFVRDPRGITADELREMRKTGMSNTAIAKAVNSKVSYVEKLIGKTPPEIAKAAMSEGARRGKAAQKNRSAESWKLPDYGAASGCGKLKPVVIDVAYDGEICEYHVMPRRQAVDIGGKKNLKGTIGFRELETLIEELMDVLTVVNDAHKRAQGATSKTVGV